MLTVKIGFSTSDWWVSKVIRLFTQATVSHTYIVFDDTASPFGHEVYQAAWDGFVMSTRDKLTRGTTRIIQEVPVDIDPKAALGMCRAWLETPYDYLGLVGEAWVQVGKLFGQRWNNPLAGAHHMFCSEAATYLLQMCPGGGISSAKVVGVDPRKEDPEALLKALTTP
jgi:hypothetical protein